MAAPAALAIDAACTPVIKASEARMNQPAWHMISESVGVKMEVIKAGGQFFRLDGDKWVKFPVNIDEVERKYLAQVARGEIKIQNCKVGTELVDGIPMTAVVSETIMPGAPPTKTTMIVGKLDGLPYRQTGSDVKVTYRYKGVAAPKL